MTQLHNKINLVTKNKFKSFFIGTIPLWNLINESFWKSFFGPFFAYIFPLIFIAILGSVLGYYQVLGGSLAISPMAITTTSMPLLIFEFKKSTLLKRIGSTPIKPGLFIFVVVFFYLLIIISSIVWSIIFSMLIFGITYWNDGKVISDNANVKLIAMNFMQTLKTVNWGGFIYGQIFLTITGLLLGMFLTAVAKSIISIQSIGVTVLILSQFLTSMVLPIATTRQIDALWFIGYIISPFKGQTNIVLESWNGHLAKALEPTTADVTGAAIPLANVVPNMVMSQNEGMKAAMNAMNSGAANGTTTMAPMASNMMPQQQMPPQVNRPPMFELKLENYIVESRPFDIYQNYIYFNQEGKSVVILDEAQKVVSLTLPFFWIGLFAALSIKFFRWSAR